MKVDGCSIHLKTSRPMHRVAVSIDEGAQQAKALVETFLPFTTKGKNRRSMVGRCLGFLGDLNIGKNLMDVP